MIPFADLRAQHRSLKTEIEAAVLEVLDSGNFVLGPSVERFEERFAQYCGSRHAVALSSGTSALHLALLAAGIRSGDEVITVPMTFVATVSAIQYAGARPVLVDIDPVSWTMDPAKLAAAITNRTKAIIPVHLHGLIADMDPIMQIAKDHGLSVIEDAAQAHGAVYRDKRAGSIGHIGCFSFYPSKNLGACGEGGAVVTDDPGIAQSIRCLRDWGQNGKYNHVIKGFNYRMDGIQGAILDVKLRHLDRWTELRRSHARRYGECLACLGWQLPWGEDRRRHAYHVYAPLVTDREAMQRRFRAADVITSVHYPRPIHLQPAFADLGYVAGDFPVTEDFARRTLSLPMFPELTERQIESVAKAAYGVSRVAAD
jgi:dTDP-4-amino-4,6-dideoxygalactose transaminase